MIAEQIAQVALEVDIFLVVTPAQGGEDQAGRPQGHLGKGQGEDPAGRAEHPGHPRHGRLRHLVALDGITQRR